MSAVLAFCVGAGGVRLDDFAGAAPVELAGAGAGFAAGVGELVAASAGFDAGAGLGTGAGAGAGADAAVESAFLLRVDDFVLPAVSEAAEFDAEPVAGAAAVSLLALFLEDFFDDFVDDASVVLPDDAAVSDADALLLFEDFLVDFVDDVSAAWPEDAELSAVLLLFLDFFDFFVLLADD